MLELLNCRNIERVREKTDNYYYVIKQNLPQFGNTIEVGTKCSHEM